MPTLAAAINVYLSLDRSIETNRNYATTLNRMAADIGPGRNVERISYEDLVDYTASLRLTVKQSTFVQYLRVIKPFFRWAVETGYLSQSPAAGIIARKPAVDPDVDKAIPPDILAKMLEVSISKPRNYAMLLFLADTGCRIGAVASLVISKLNLENNSAVVLEKGGKYERVYFGPITAETLKAWLEIRPQVKHDFVFTGKRGGEPLQKSGMKALIYRLSERVSGQVYGPHSFRHAVGNSYAEAGVPPHVTQHKLNHAKLETTLRYYYPRRADNLPEVSQAFDLAPLRRQSKETSQKEDISGKILRFSDYAQDA